MESIWTKAKKMELEAIRYYNELAEKSESQEAAGVFSMIAKEEKKHAEMFEILEQNGSLSGSIPENSWDPKDAFVAIAKREESVNVLESALEAYKKIVTIEYENVAYYESLKDSAKGDLEKDALDFIIKEEKKHAKIFEALVEFIQLPEFELESAEF